MSGKNTLAHYSDRRVQAVFIFGMASGLPWVLIGSALTLWLKESGVSRSAIGYTGLIYATYAINFLWSPLVDRVAIPGFRRWLGQRQSWIVPCLLCIALACAGMAQLGTEHGPKWLAALGLLIAFASATQDIAIDAYRIDSFGPDETALQSTAAGAATAGWWSGYAGLGFIPLYLSDAGWSWPSLYLLMGAIPLSLALLTFLLPSPAFHRPPGASANYERLVRANSQRGHVAKFALMVALLSPLLLAFWGFVGSPGMNDAITSHTAYIPVLILAGLILTLFAAWVMSVAMRATPRDTASRHASLSDRAMARTMNALCEPVQDFFTRNGVRLAIQILLFIFLFKLGEAFLGKMSIVFYKEVGFSNTDIATYSKMLTWWVTIIAALFAGALNARFGLVKGLFISGVLMAGSNLMFAWIAWVGPSIPLYIATIIVDGVAAAWSLVAFVAFISALCNHQFSASQYALLASLGALGRTTLSSLSGVVVDLLGGNWPLFFVLTTLMVVPSLLLLLVIARKVKPATTSPSSSSAS